jgi:hypothetical protein
VETHALPERSYREIGLAWRQGSTRGEEFRQFGDLLRDLTKQLGLGEGQLAGGVSRR